MEQLTLKKIYIFLFSTFLFYGCSEDFLDVDSREKIEAGDSEEVFEPDDFVTSTYGMLTDWDYAFSWLGVTEIISDNADKGSTPTSTGTDKHFLDGLTHTSTTPSIAAMWERWYKSIGRASYAIEYAEEYGLTDEDYKNRLIGEAKFLRALNYFWLVRMFGDVSLQHTDLLTRAPEEEVYDFIEQDLLDAIATLPNKSEYASGDLGRATKGAAQALLAKVYLYKKQWEDALNYAGMVMTSGEYSLEPNYEDIWRVYSENGVESIFEVQARGEQIAHGVNQYSQTQAPRGTGGWGWGFNVPSEDLLNAFNEEGDTIRRDATIIFRGETLWDGREVSGSVENPMYNEKAYSSANLGDADGDKNVRILRLAEVLLIHAEAANELGDSNTALTSLNQVRARVKLPEVTTTDQGQLRELIWKERRLELAFEHDRWFDLIRTGQAGEVMRAHGKPFEDGKHELFPVPNDQINQTPEMTQNPGW
ncbi:RagB/SusD family nutrient uptake outer membrane protein [Sinomicrobium pectinilyticum]|uniref:RagB/SusD family nutrient uptake outer membrane protein n=1 Tax=Sinomicrobium pectinilyticum TaxID=1084421 RepID=A0A3N0F4S7_SINP1|nr:RagB/SusD family nutrient uptake outer membrane protein [Sinomicrobium pectinilyticum]RNL95130.1 RagB/SusD family nutrient uptake outer membrane protein [Sinomicrobium pectinilyticum]